MIPHCCAFLLAALLLVPAAGKAAGKAGMARATIIGQIDVQYDYVDAEDKRDEVPDFADTDNDGTEEYHLIAAPSFPTRSRIQLRRMRLGADIDLNHGFSAKIIAALDLKNNDGPAPYADRRDYLDQAALYWQGEGRSRLRIGYGKMPFGVENLTPSKHLPVIERSAASHYFTGVTEWGGSEGRPHGYVCTPLGLGARANSVLWQSALASTHYSVHYHLALSYNSLNPFGAGPENQRKDWGVYAGLGYQQDSENRSYDAGLNVVWRSQGVAYFPIGEQRAAPLIAFNPYLKLSLGKFHFLGEYFHGIAEHSQIITGGFYDDAAPSRAASAPTARSHGINAIFHYDLAAAPISPISPISLVARYAYLDAGGASFSSGYFSDIVPGAPQPLETSSFNKAHALYGGVVYRQELSPQAVVQFSFGYEFVRASEDLSFRQLIDNAGVAEDLRARGAHLLSSARTNVHALRFRVQTVF